MRKLLNYTRSKLAALFNKITKRTVDAPVQNIQALRVAPWLADNGDKTYRLDYNLNENSVVFDLGGYEGQWASDIFSKYTCFIYVFEPFDLYAKKIAQRFLMNPKISAFNYGLSNRNMIAQLGINNDASSVFKPGDETVDISLVKIEDFLMLMQLSHIDLMKINIEGGEYDILEHLIENKLISKIENIQVQFHDFVPDAENRMQEIQRKLSLTHKLTYQYIFVWENWTLIK
jgi:FkbM family methyltransferase